MPFLPFGTHRTPSLPFFNINKKKERKKDGKIILCCCSTRKANSQIWCSFALPCATLYPGAPNVPHHNRFLWNVVCIDLFCIRGWEFCVKFLLRGSPSLRSAVRDRVAGCALTFSSYLVKSSSWCFCFTAGT